MALEPSRHITALTYETEYITHETMSTDDTLLMLTRVDGSTHPQLSKRHTRLMLTAAETPSDSFQVLGIIRA